MSGGLEIKACEGIVNLFANAILERNYQLAYGLTTSSYQKATRYDAFIRSDQEMQASTGHPTSWEMPSNARLLAESGEGSFIVFRARYEDGNTAAYATYVRFEKDTDGKCRLGDLEFSPWVDPPPQRTMEQSSNDAIETDFVESWGDEE